MRGPLIFRGPGGDVDVFRDAPHATSYAEAIDVANGEYGEHGWDADGRLVALVVRLDEPGFLGRLFPCFVPTGVVEIRQLDEAPQPEVLRRILRELFVEHDIVDAESVKLMTLEELTTRSKRLAGP